MSDITITLKPHQQEVIDRNPVRWLGAHGTGTGKTITGIYLADKNCKSCLVITLKDGKKRWIREIEEHSSGACKFLVMTKEEFKRDHIELGPFDGLIIDECHAFAGMKSQLSKALRAYLRKYDIRYRWFLSATPITATPWSVYVLMNHLGANLNYYKFLRKFFYEIKMGTRKVFRPNPNAEDKLIELIQRVGDFVKLDDVVSVPTQKNIVESFEMTEEQNEASENLEDMEHIVRWTKMHQIENGTLAGNEYEGPKTYDCAKNDRILEIVKTWPKVAVFARYNHQLREIETLLAHLNRPIFVINGENKDRDDTVQKVEKMSNCIVLINSSCATGYELPSIGTIIFASMSFSYLDYEQARGRFLRINRLKENTYYHLVTKGGVDEGVYDCIMGKKDFYIELFKK